MPRLLIHVEGETEETFVNELLREHLCRIGYQAVSARIVGNARQRSRRGGIRPWPSVRMDIVRHLREDAGCIATTMVDYYGLPQNGTGAWPGRAAASHAGIPQKPTLVEHALALDIAEAMGGAFDQQRFIPFVVMHEFEGLLFSDCSSFAQSIGLPKIGPLLQVVRDSFDTPEDINDSPVTAPSKRVINLIPEYQKPVFGNLAALGMGLDVIRGACPHFNRWISRLEELVRYPRGG